MHTTVIHSERPGCTFTGQGSRDHAAHVHGVCLAVDPRTHKWCRHPFGHVGSHAALPDPDDPCHQPPGKTEIRWW